jgi:hypothetical protein
MIQLRMPASSSATLRCADLRSFRSVSSANQRSATLSHDELARVKCRWNRCCRSSRLPTAGGLVRGHSCRRSGAGPGGRGPGSGSSQPRMAPAPSPAGPCAGRRRRAPSPVNCGPADSFPHQGQQHSSCPAYQAADPNRVPSAVLGFRQAGRAAGRPGRFAHGTCARPAQPWHNALGPKAMGSAWMPGPGRPSP